MPTKRKTIRCYSKSLKSISLPITIFLVGTYSINALHAQTNLDRETNFRIQMQLPESIRSECGIRPDTRVKNFSDPNYIPHKNAENFYYKCAQRVQEKLYNKK